MSEALLYPAIVVIGYLIGAIPTGPIVAALYGGGVDLTRSGTRKTGSMNALWTLGRRAAVVVLFGDLAKTIIAVLIARRLAGDGSAQPSAEALAGLAAMIGHNWSIYIGFKGGQGVAILYATLLIICWPAVLIASLSTFAMLKLGRIVSLASLTGTVVTVIVLAVYVAWGRAPLPYLIFDILAVGLIGLRHRDDIQRFIAWTKSNAPWAYGPGTRE